MALPIPSPSGFFQIPNRGFESGPTGWTTSGTANVVNESQMTGSWCAKASGTDSPGSVTTSVMYPVVPGQSISLTLALQMTAGSPGTSVSADFTWYDGTGTFLSTSEGAQVTRQAVSGNKSTASVNASAPAGAGYVRPRTDMNTAVGSTIYVDDFSWNYDFPVAVSLTQPGLAYTPTDEVLFRLSVNGLPSGTTVTSVNYRYLTWDGSDYTGDTSLTITTDSPFSYNAPAMAVGKYAGYALVTLSNGVVLTTAPRLFEVSTSPVPPADEREYKASNAYTYLIGENFQSLGSSIPATASVLGAEILVDYSMDVLSRPLDNNVSDPAQSNPSTVFSMLASGVVEAVLLSKSGDAYSVVGAPMTGAVPIAEADFVVDEQGTSDGKMWVVHQLDDPAQVVVGDSDLLFGQASINAPDFMSMAVGLRFYPVLGTKPAYAASGDACVRFKIDAFKLRVYFDAGSIEYYFDTAGGVVKGELGASYVISGSFTTGDAAGVMQMLPSLPGTISAGDTIHSANPPTPANQIAVVSEDMEYNWLPTYYQTETNRSRYQFITANFYGDPLLDSIYGANGVDRGFAYNGDYFYKIFTHPELGKDRPRHVAFHHSHLALGYGEGRVDLSVVGEPYNFDGAMGASSWAIGDSVTGLLPLSGTMLGMFCKKSVWGLSGTTVDNFATQVISPKLGAVEYTATDMGFPVYANAYGVYTLEQTNSYGDFLGNPMSQSVSPWLRPRLVRSATSDKEVVVAWPVRSKNQYKLAFADGYVLTMTMNYGTQQTPTFSKQKYFLFEDAVFNPAWEYPSIVPAAISSELDDSGEERIHVANKVHAAPPAPQTPVLYYLADEGSWVPDHSGWAEHMPSWFVWGDDFYARILNSGNDWMPATFNSGSGYQVYLSIDPFPGQMEIASSADGANATTILFKQAEKGVLYTGVPGEYYRYTTSDLIDLGYSYPENTAAATTMYGDFGISYDTFLEALLYDDTPNVPSHYTDYYDGWITQGEVTTRLAYSVQGGG